MYVSESINLIASKDSEFLRKFFDEAHDKVTSTKVERATPFKGDVPNSSEQVLPMGDITTGKLAYIKSDQPITLKITSSAGTNQLIPVESVFFLDGSFTAISIVNNSGSTAEITAFLGGV